MADNNKVAEDEKGGVAFIVMMCIIAYLLVTCVVLPLVIENYSAQSFALPVMASGLALPFVYFFIFGGMALANKKKDK